MALAEKQGQLGDLYTMSLTELRELLKRQEKLVSNPAIVKRLPDKGSKIFAFIDKIKDAITQVENVDKTADLFEKMAIQSECNRQQRFGITDEDYDAEIIEELAMKVHDDKIIIDEREKGYTVSNLNEKLIKKADKQSSKFKFRPNRTIRNKDVQNIIALPLFLERDVVSEIQTLPNINEDGLVELRKGQKSVENSNCMDSDTATADNNDKLCKKISTEKPRSGKPMQMDSSAGRKLRQTQNTKPPTEDITESRGKLRYRYDESLETQIYTGQSRCQQVKMIKIQESVILQQKQQKAAEELQAKYAAERLAERLHIKMDEFKPEGQECLSYRDQPNASDSDDDGSDNNDFPE